MMRREKRSKKIKKIITIIIIIAVIIVGIVIAIRKIENKNKNKESDNSNNKKQQVYELPNTTYSGMEVTNIELEYLESNSQTMVTMRIKNTSDKTVKEQSFYAVFYDIDNNELIRALTTITKMDPNDEHNVSVILSGDFTSIARIKLLEDGGSL